MYGLKSIKSLDMLLIFMRTFDEYELGRTDDTIKIDTREENQLVVISMACQCKKTIDIISRDLDPDLFDNADFIDAAKAMVLGNRRAKVRMLVLDPKKIVTRGHRLLELVRSLPTFLEIRIPAVEHKDFNEMLFVADSTGYLHRLNHDRFEATLNFNDKRVSKHLVKEFDEIWAKATQDTNLRKLTI